MTKSGSKEELMNDEWRQRLERRKEDLLTCVEMLETGRVGSHEMRDGRQVDTSAEWARRFRDYVAELEALIAQR